MTRRRRLWAVLAAVGVLVAVGAPVVWYVQRPPTTVETVGADTAEALASAAPTPAPTTPASTAPTRAAPAVPAVPTTDGRLGRDGTTSAPVPVEVRLPGIGVTAPVGPIGVERDGVLEIPEDVRTVGWYQFGPRPGDPRGSTLLSGHVDSAEQGQGAFYRLRELGPGDEVLVRLSDRSTWRYRVVAREEWPKTDTPLDRLFARSGAPRLTLVTCGGGFREDTSSYTDNIAVTAVPEGRG